MDRLRKTIGMGTYVLLPILLWGVMIGAINSIVLLLIFFILFLFLTKDGMTIVSVFILCPLLGLIKEVAGGGIPGTVVAFVIILIIQREKLIEAYKQLNLRTSAYLLLILFFVFFSYILTARTENSNHKIIALLLNTIVYTTGLLMIVKSSKESIRYVVPFFFIYGLILLRLPIDYFGYAEPNGLLDFSFYRESTVMNKDIGLKYVTYHSVGIAGVLSTSFLLCTRKSLRFLDYLLLFCCIWLVLLSGARQAITAYVLIIACWYSIKTGKLRIKNVLLILMLIPVLIIILQHIDAPQIQQMFEDRGGADKYLNRNYDYPLTVISNNTLTGIGFGNYLNPYTLEVYPHNIIIELLCEMGLLGLLFFLVLTIIFTRGTHFTITKQMNNGCFCVLLLLPYLTRAMISLDLSENIIVFLAYSVFFFLSQQGFRDVNILQKMGHKKDGTIEIL